MGFILTVIGFSHGVSYALWVYPLFQLIRKSLLRLRYHFSQGLLVSKIMPDMVKRS